MPGLVMAGEYEHFALADMVPTPIDSLPNELFSLIFSELLEDDTISDRVRTKTLTSCLRVSARFYDNTVSAVLSHVSFPYSRTFAGFLKHLAGYPEHGQLVRTIDFSAFSPLGSGFSESKKKGIKNLTADTLLDCLEKTPGLRTLLVSEHLQDELDEAVLNKVFGGLPFLEAVDFCSASGPQFVNAFSAVTLPSNPLLPPALTIRRLGLHHCNTLPAASLASLLSRLPALTHLDLTDTRISEKGLWAIPDSAQITHLSLSKCRSLTGPGVVEFLVGHPATAQLVYLNLMYALASYRLLSASDVDDLLPNLPGTLKSLNLYGADVKPDHVPQLQALCVHLEELSLGYADLGIEDIDTLVQHRACNLKFLDLNGVSSLSPGVLFNSALLKPNCPVQILEIKTKVAEALKGHVLSKRHGWEVDLGEGNRAWFHRKAVSKDDGSRPWKMGERRWGMKKVPIGYGSFKGLYKRSGFHIL